MNTYIAVVFSSDDKARSALRTLWHLDEQGELTVHGATLVRRDDLGNIRVGESRSDLGVRTAIGVGVGALLGLLAGPVGLAAGVAGTAVLSAGAVTGFGALAGAAIGARTDVIAADRREDAAYHSLLSLKHGQSAVLADISEDWTSVLDDAMQPLGGTIYRRINNAATNAAFGADYYYDHLYPYEYEPIYA